MQRALQDLLPSAMTNDFLRPKTCFKLSSRGSNFGQTWIFFGIFIILIFLFLIDVGKLFRTINTLIKACEQLYFDQLILLLPLFSS